MIQIGQQVLYVLSEQDSHTGEVRPAIVVRVWSNICVNLLVFRDGDNAQILRNGEWVPGPWVDWQTSRLRDDNKTPGTWHLAQPTDDVPMRAQEELVAWVEECTQ